MGYSAQSTFTWGVELPADLNWEEDGKYDDRDKWLLGKLMGLSNEQPTHDDPEWPAYWKAEQEAAEKCKFELYPYGSDDGEKRYVLGHKNRTVEGDWGGAVEVPAFSRTWTHCPRELGEALTKLGLPQTTGRWLLLSFYG